jgi:SAM-dependent methyltransferase
VAGIGHSEMADSGEAGEARTEFHWCMCSSLQKTTPWDRIGASIYDRFLNRGEELGMSRRRARTLADARGRVLEIGAGTGLNLDHYPAAVDELVLAEPVGPMAARLERRAEATDLRATVVRAAAEQLPFEDGSFDTVVSTLVLCTVEDPELAVAEIARVLRPGGSFLFIEHVEADEPGLARRQQRWHRPWRTFGSGCNTNRRTLELFGDGPLRVGTVERASWDGMPAIVSPLIAGRAVAEPSA